MTVQRVHPERIGRYEYDPLRITYTEPPAFISGQTEYVRADLYEQAVRALAVSREGSEGGQPTDYFGVLVERARVAAAKATVKFPQPNYVTLKIAEEAGEVVRGAVHYAEGRMTWEEVEGEIVQLIAMLIRFVTEGDQINGVTPPAALAASKGEA